MAVEVVCFAFTDVWGGEETKYAASTAEKSLAVLPFTNRSSDQENAQFLADGSHDDLLTLLANMNSLMVISRTSVITGALDIVLPINILAWTLFYNLFTLYVNRPSSLVN